MYAQRLTGNPTLHVYKFVDKDSRPYCTANGKLVTVKSVKQNKNSNNTKIRAPVPSVWLFETKMCWASGRFLSNFSRLSNGNSCYNQ